MNEQHRNRTRILRTDATAPNTSPSTPPHAQPAHAQPARPVPAPGQSAHQSPHPHFSPRPNNHRVVLGRGARKIAGLGHVAGARMIIARKESRAPRRGPSRPAMLNKGEDVIPPLAPDSIRIIPFGGVEEIGRNMTAIEFGGDIIVVDIGFQFKDENTPGIDYILPNTKYLETRRDKIRAVLITHGHLDHIGGIPYIMPRIGNPPMYTRMLTSILIQKRQEEFPHVPKIDMRVVEKKETITVGKFKIKFFAVTHTIPDAMGIIIETPYGSIVHTGDLKLDHVDGIPTPEDVE